MRLCPWAERRIAAAVPGILTGLQNTLISEPSSSGCLESLGRGIWVESMLTVINKSFEMSDNRVKEATDTGPTDKFSRRRGE